MKCYLKQAEEMRVSLAALDIDFCGCSVSSGLSYPTGIPGSCTATVVEAWGGIDSCDNKHKNNNEWVEVWAC